MEEAETSLTMRPSSAALRGTQWLLLEQIAVGLPMATVLDGIVRFIERQSSEMKCSILLLEPDGLTLRHGAAPNLPPSYTKAIDGAKIGPQAGSCGTAAFRREVVVVSDIATHPYWTDYKHLILPHGYRACWSTPVTDKDQTVLGTFAMYYTESRGPTEAEREWVRVATHLAALAIARDRSEHERARLLGGLESRLEALRQSEERFAAVISNSPHVGVQWYDAKGRLLFANDASYRLLGWTGLNPLGKTLDELNFPAEEAARFNAEVAEVARTGEPRGPIEFQYTREDGSPGLLLSTVFKIPDSAGDDCFVCMDVDVTAHRRAEARAHESDKLRALIYSNVSDIMFYLAVEPHSQYRFLSVNAAFTEATGLNEDAVAGKLVQDVIPEPSLAQVLSKYGEAIEKRSPVSWLEVSDYPTGKKYGEVKVVPVFDSAGKCTNLVGTVHDLTQHKQAEEERRRLEEQLQRAQRIQALGTLAGGMAHDFNNILTAILAHVDLAHAAPKNADLLESLAAIRKAGHRGSDLVRRLLRYSRHDTPNRERVQLERVVDEVFELLRATTPKSIRLTTSISESLPEIDADPTQVHQILVNLCTNAAHAMQGGGGVIEINAAVVTLGDEDADLKAGSYIDLTVSDTGSGMDAATLERIFEPFFTTKGAGKGTGLGLSVVQGIMRTHGGAVRVESEIGRGTTFHLYFPRAEPLQKKNDRPPPPPPQGDGRHVVYIDDDEDLLLLTSLMLRRLGFRVTTFTRARDALDALADPSMEVDGVVSDVSMPGMDGPRLILAIRKLRPGLRAVLVSGYAHPEDLDAVQEIGGAVLVSKPTTVEGFAQLLRDLFLETDPGEPARFG